MKPKTLILMVVAVGCGLVASVMTSRLIADREPSDSQEKRVKVVVAKAKVKAFDLIKEPEKFFIEKELPESAVPKKAVRSLEDVKDKRPLRPLPEESFVTTDDLASKDLNGLAATLRPGSRAVAIRVSPESLAGGFVLPASHVDILHTLRRNDDTRTSTLLQNMLILAVDMNPNADPERHAMLGNTVTVCATPLETQRLTLASGTGELRLTLRPLGEDKLIAIKSTSLEELTKPLSEEEATTTSTQPAAPTNLASLVPTLPSLPEPEKTPETKPVAVVPAEPVVKKHTLTLHQGEKYQQVTFIKGSGATTTEPAEPTPAPSNEPATKPEPTKEPETPAQPTPRGTRE